MSDANDDTLAADALQDAGAADTQTAARGRSAGPRRRAGPSLSQGDRIGRYLILDKLGAGGMGVVYAAYDPELDRKLAVKVLHPDLAGAGTDGPVRLLREAQALARVSHPNVVAVHDVGRHNDEVWLAMEFLAGQTLDAWLAEARRPWADVLAMLMPAARGLAAAHAANVLHRDIKPHNMMIGDDGRVRVVDFGLAREAIDEAPRDATADLAADTPEPSARHLASALTEFGATPGTPAYMAPEHFVPAAIDARTDQFSFCVTLWEALYGQRPFGGASVPQLVANIIEGRHRPLPPDRKVPRWLHAVVLRGLSTDPDARWASVEALVDAVDRGRQRARRRSALAVVGVLGLAGATAWAAPSVVRRHKVAACEAQGATIEALWNDDERTAVRTSLLGSGAGHAATTADKVMPWIDAHAVAWRRAQTEACIATDVEARWDTEALGRAQWCLDERRGRLGALIEELKHADTARVTHAVTAAAGLSDLSLCLDVPTLRELPAPPTGEQQAVAEIRATLSQASALSAVGAWPAGLQAAQRALTQARALGWPPLVASAERAVGKALERNGDYADSETMLEQAFFDAAKARATNVAMLAAEDLVYTVTERLQRHRDGERWAKHADVLRERLPDPSGFLRVRGLGRLALVRDTAGAYREAARLYEEALSIAESGLGPEHPSTTTLLGNLAAVRFDMGEFDESERLAKRALTALHAAFGPDHPQVAHGLVRLGVVQHARDEREHATESYARAATIMEAALGAEHPDLAIVLHNQANLHADAGEVERAEALHRRSAEIRKRAYGPDHPAVAESLGGLAGLVYAAGRDEEAAALFEEELQIKIRTLGDDHPHVALTLGNLAAVRSSLEEYEDAAGLLSRALAMTEAAKGRQHPGVAWILDQLARVRAAAGLHAEAAALHDRALSIYEARFGPDHPRVALSLNRFADLLIDRKAWAEAKPLYTRALTILEKKYGPDYHLLGGLLVGLGMVALAQGRPAEAIRYAERGVRVREADEGTAAELAEAQFLLAQALVAGGQPGERATDLAQRALKVYEDAGEIEREGAAEVQAFLREHGPRARRASPRPRAGSRIKTR